MRCPTKHGNFQCDRESGHGGECATDAGPRSRVVSVDLDAQRELRRAAARIEVLRKALQEIRTAPCGDGTSAASCACCLHDRMIATAALAVLE